MEYLFQSIPMEYQICNLELMYSTNQDGYSLTTLYNKAKKYENSKGMILILKTSTGSVFGAFCNKVFQLTEVYYLGSEDTFVFTLYPNREIFKSQGLNMYFLRCDNTYFSIGNGGDGEAIRLNEDFGHGPTCCSETFGNKPLTGEGGSTIFKCSEFEAYALVQ